MAAPMELYCWKGDWGLPSVDPDCLTVLTYARFSGAPLKVHKLSNPWRSPSGKLPALKTPNDGVLFQPAKIITHLRKQKYNADYDLSARQGADTLAFISLLEEKLLPALIHSFWVDAKNYVDHTRKWYAEAIPFPLNFYIPNQMHKRHLEHLQLIRGESWREDDEVLEKQLYTDAQECLSLLSQRLGTQRFFFGECPASLDAHIFSHLAPILNAKLPNNRLQQHLKSLNNLSQYVSSILSIYFNMDGEALPHLSPKSPKAESPDIDDEPNKRRNQILSVAFGLLTMVSYALLSGIISIQHASRGVGALEPPIAMEDNDEDEE
ncbi:PREDICTED: metaxin-1 [Nanorana parkeri]|uniref:metaxin-1 n=1 Tax=Nanorana parkeri TaxID=125878 RepID=UPI0008541854|nr:PREDICTED: metaxin-1 [Nanorana parkeri]